MKKNYIIYRILNLVTRKWYIGQTTTTLQKRWWGHKKLTKKNGEHYRNGKVVSQTYLLRSMLKYGFENFEIKEIDRASSLSHLKWLESFYIQYYNSNNNKYGYNLSLNTDNRELTEESLYKYSLASHRRLGATGVTWYKPRNRWVIRFEYLGQKIVKFFKDEATAKETKDLVSLIKYADHAILYFPEKRNEYLKKDLKEFHNKISNFKKAKYANVRKEHGKFSVRMDIEGIRHYLGTYETEEDAAIARDKVVTYLYGNRFKLHFSELLNENYFIEGESIYTRFVINRKKIRVSNSTAFQIKS